MGFGVSSFGFGFEFFYLLVIWIWISYLNLLYFSLLICIMGIIVFFNKFNMRVKIIYIYKVFGIVFDIDN